jgi:hypothetical protein
LQHSISQKYFTGGSSALAAAAVAKGAGNGVGEVGGVMPGSKVAQTVGFAPRLKESRSGGEAGGSGSGEGRGPVPGKGKKEKARKSGGRRRAMEERLTWHGSWDKGGLVAAVLSLA